MIYLVITAFFVKLCFDLSKDKNIMEFAFLYNSNTCIDRFACDGPLRRGARRSVCFRSLWETILAYIYISVMCDKVNY